MLGGGGGGGVTTIMVPLGVVEMSVVVMVIGGGSVGARGYSIIVLWNMLNGADGERHAGVLEASR